MKIVLLLVLLVSSLLISAQKTIDVTSGDVNVSNFFLAVNGEPVLLRKFTKLVEGSPYFKDEWWNSTIVLANDRQYNNIKTKIDLLDGELRYLDEKGKEMIAPKNIKEAILFDSIRNLKYHFIHSSTLPASNSGKQGWYQSLHTGQASLYKYFKKFISENKPYGSTTTEQTIRTTESYLVMYNNALVEIKKIKDAPAVLANKKGELEEYLKTKDNKNLSTDDRMTALIAYYNSLFK